VAGEALDDARRPGICAGSGHAGWARTFIDGTIVAGSVPLSKDGKVIRVHQIRHERSRELGACANPQPTRSPIIRCTRSRSVRKLSIELL
jgi:hypothetical protein